MTPWRNASRRLKNIEAALKQAGSGFADVVRVHYLMTDGADFERCWPAMGKAFGEVRPAATMMVVGLADTKMKIEIEVTALRRKSASAQEESGEGKAQEVNSDYEKLGVFYLGREFDPAKNALRDDLVLYDSKDLTTHAVCVGMTGSGKTGLCISLLEEAAIDGVPAICIDPKGDLGNLLLTFPELAASDFEPWVDAGEAARKGVSVPEFAAATAETWKKGLAEWDQAPERIGRLKAAADVAIYTPGAGTGIPLSVLRSFAPPAGRKGSPTPGALPSIALARWCPACWAC